MLRTSARLRSAAIYVAIVAIMFLVSFAAGFVYSHEPQRDTVTVAVAESPATPSAERSVGGTVLEVRGGALTLRGEQGNIEVTLPGGVPVDDLQHVAGDAPFAAGTRVNVGGQQTQSGLVVTGVVALERAAQ